MTMNRANILCIKEDIPHVQLLGTAVDPAMLKELNDRLMNADSNDTPMISDIPSPVESDNMNASKAELIIEKNVSNKYGHPVKKETSQMIEISHMAISILGNTASTAYLHIEFIVKGNEYSALMYDIGLEGSNFTDSFNKDFASLDYQPRKVLFDFFVKLASWFTFTGSKAPINDGLLAKLHSQLGNSAEAINIRFTKMEIFAISISSALQVELTSADSGKKLLIMIPATKLGYQEADDSSKCCESSESYDLYDLLDEHFYGDMSNQLSYHAKAELVHLFWRLSKLYAFENTFSVIMSMA